MVAGIVVVGACGGEAPLILVPTTDDSGRPLSDGRQRSESFLTETSPSDDLADELADELADDDTPPSDETTSTVKTSTTLADTSTTLSPAETSTPGSTTQPADDDPFAATTKAFDRFTKGDNAPTAVSLTITRNGETIFERAAGRTHGDAVVGPDSPMLVVGISKLVTALAVSRLAQDGLLDLSAPVPWEAIGLTTNGKWAEVTVQALVDQTSGMPPTKDRWAKSETDCRTNVAAIVSGPPQKQRQGKRFDSNGNACVLGLLIEGLTGETLDVAIQRLVFEPAGLDGFHTTAAGLLPGDGGVIEDGVTTSTGGAGTYLVSTEDLAAVFGSLSDLDREIFSEFAVMTDQYGWGHTGIAKAVSACLWMLEDGATVVAGAVAGGNAKGAVVCDRIVPALAGDLELGLGKAKPKRTK